MISYHYDAPDKFMPANFYIALLKQDTSENGSSYELIKQIYDSHYKLSMIIN